MKPKDKYLKLLRIIIYSLLNVFFLLLSIYFGVKIFGDI